MRNGDRQQINIIDESTILNEPELKQLKVFYFKCISIDYGYCDATVFWFSYRI